MERNHIPTFTTEKADALCFSNGACAPGRRGSVRQVCQATTPTSAQVTRPGVKVTARCQRDHQIHLQHSRNRTAIGLNGRQPHRHLSVYLSIRVCERLLQQQKCFGMFTLFQQNLMMNDESLLCVAEAEEHQAEHLGTERETINQQ
ncbi:hypothetical protein IRJ41_000424 [Triplophysa rosa]|uniref:Uncharacterized protein n=1 Tax=Triplophysa rosa TaxID=992332 RepID=A0A9W7WC54_TRIRA|nr:hypothetical protein IRJ41_000424 [Triplophysa rosa]